MRPKDDIHPRRWDRYWPQQQTAASTGLDSHRGTRTHPGGLAAQASSLRCHLSGRQARRSVHPARALRAQRELFLKTGGRALRSGCRVEYIKGCLYIISDESEIRVRMVVILTDACSTRLSNSCRSTASSRTCVDQLTCFTVCWITPSAPLIHGAWSEHRYGPVRSGIIM